MTQLRQLSENLCDKAKTITEGASLVLNQAPLTDAQREDMEAVRKASQEFHRTLLALPPLDQTRDPELLSHTRHQLRNYLNIVVGMTRIMIRELPDNLLLQMATVRTMHQNGQELMTEVDQLR
ncbi:MAG: hypothetical protein KC496_14235 [Anaerolineae bacterium]|nr:hypothetical protein [Anaerolineae bacterium]